MIEIANTPSLFSLVELSQAVESLLAKENLLKTNQDKRVSSIPDARTIRYYRSLHLLDRPKIIKRQAFYEERHLLQVLAIKALQGLSMPLSEIQARLYGRTNDELISILTAISGERAKGLNEIRLIRWREVTLEEGLKLLAEEKWNLKESKMSLLTEKFQNALVSLEQTKENIERGKK
jgi:DNA-binding transcriptional MerR regulator